MKLVHFTALISGLFLVSACGAAFKGAPRTSIDPNRNVAAAIINNTLSESELEKWSTQTPTRSKRNAIIEARMAEIDVLYYAFENELSREIRGSNFATSLAGVVVGTAGSLAGGDTSQNLSALSSAISGTSAAFQKEILIEQSVQAFISQMRANRSGVRARITQRLDLEVPKYTLQAAVSDLAEYEQAGTLSAAVAGLAKAAKEKEETATTNLQNIQIARDRAPLLPTEEHDAINNYIASATSTEESQSRTQQAVQCFDEAPVANKPANFSDYNFNPSRNTDLGIAIRNCLNDKFKAGI